MDESYTWCWPLDWMYIELGIKGRLIAVDYPAHWWMWDSGASLHTKRFVFKLVKRKTMKVFFC